jgi:hypothetical protein
MTSHVIEAARPALDLTRHHFVRELGEFRLYGTWYYAPTDDNSDDTEPCLVLVPAVRSVTKPCVVLLQHAYKWTNPRYAAQMSLEFAKTLGFDSNVMATATRIHGMIFDHLLDLITLPEDPTETVVGASGSVKFGGGPSRSIELLDHIPIAQA